MGQLGQLGQLRRHVFGGGERIAIVFNQLELAGERHLKLELAHRCRRNLLFSVMENYYLRASDILTGTRAHRTGTREGMGRRPSCATWAAAGPALLCDVRGAPSTERRKHHQHREPTSGSALARIKRMKSRKEEGAQNVRAWCW